MELGLDDFSRVSRVVAAEGVELAAHRAAGEGVEESLDARMLLDEFFRHDQIVALRLERNELEPEEPGDNNDIAEYWEWSDAGWFPIEITNEAYKLGINYMVYALTH